MIRKKWFDHTHKGPIMEHPAIRNIHLIGIAGTGMGAFAGLLKAAGYNVSGSDTNTYPPMKEKLAEWKIPVKTPYNTDNLNPPPDLVIVGNVASKENVEAVAVRERNISYTSFPKALSDLFLSYCKPIVVTGTHGKTTCSCLLAHTLFDAGRDPSFLIGGIPHNFGESFRLGKLTPDSPFVVEGDEYDTAYFDKGPKFLHYQPNLLLATSVEYDHADIYANVEQIEERFTQVFELVPSNGTIVAYIDSPHLIKALRKAKIQSNVITYGPLGDIQAHDQEVGESGIAFTVVHKGQKLGVVQLSLAGQHNLNNALGCYAILMAAGLSHEEIAKGFSSFHGVKRRLEEIGEADGVLVLDDFAHHPTAVEATIQATKARYGNRPVWAIFEPRSATSCRRIFQNDYAECFHAADRVLLAPPGRALEPSQMLDVPQLAKDIAATGLPAQDFSSIDDMIATVIKDAKPGTVLLCMSNGSFSGIHQQLLNQLKTRV